jgi:hypothetical protein
MARVCCEVGWLTHVLVGALRQRAADRERRRLVRNGRWRLAARPRPGPGPEAGYLRPGGAW